MTKQERIHRICELYEEAIGELLALREEMPVFDYVMDKAIIRIQEARRSVWWLLGRSHLQGTPKPKVEPLRSP
ncbi:MULTISPECIES: hypothetical protein [Thermoactinomyces]|jgi:hypothetical protein|uniref:Uncharacterized protein n=1 Tax=Thermoactinomyces daqus TaxID=1329516 RepID=A0A7W1XDK2_9BACL|nr:MULTISPECIES: hypothetical protein [Thermoactinomyces]MBA4544583.1 hypothetical protein [Thermoactinomyces daqus]MBH8609316.1 hypothetical protein [Thermoactinomyces sp. CICC 10521]